MRRGNPRVWSYRRRLKGTFSTVVSQAADLFFEEGLPVISRLLLEMAGIPRLFTYSGRLPPCRTGSLRPRNVCCLHKKINDLMIEFCYYISDRRILRWHS